MYIYTCLYILYLLFPIGYSAAKASRSVRKAKQKNRFKYVRVPPRMFNQSEGDFPIQVPSLAGSNSNSISSSNIPLSLSLSLYSL